VQIFNQNDSETDSLVPTPIASWKDRGKIVVREDEAFVLNPSCSCHPPPRPHKDRVWNLP
jgi:hypothetical protein